MQSPPTLLDYHRPTRTPWRRYALAGLLAAVVAGGAVYGYRTVVAPMRQRAALVRTYRSDFQRLLTYRHNPSAPVMTIVDDEVHRRDPRVAERFGTPDVYLSSTSHPIPGVTLYHRYRPEGWNGSQLVHLWGLTLTNVFLHQRTAPDGRSFLVGLDVSANSRVLSFHATTFDLTAPDPAVRFYESGRAQRQTVRVAEWSFPGDACYVMPAAPDRSDPSAFTFVVHHDGGAETVRGSVQSDGTVRLTSEFPAGIESRWKLESRPVERRP